MASPDDDLVRDYWAEKSLLVGLNDLDPPGAWAFGADAEQADNLLGLVLSGVKTATSSALWVYEADDEAIPEPGDLSIVCDGRGRPRALIRTEHVDVTDFDDVPESHAYAEGEGDRSLAHWRGVHEEFFRNELPSGREFTGSMALVLERFVRLLP